MAARISIGFPLRRCSWSFRPIVPAELTRTLIQWLDSVCVKCGEESFKNVAKTRATVNVT